MGRFTMRTAIPALLSMIVSVQPVAAAPKRPLPVPPPPPVFVATAPAAAPILPASPARTALATEFATLYVPEDIVRAGAAREFEKNFRASFESVPANVELEKRYPGSRDAALRAGIGAVSRFMDENLPAMRKSVADTVAQRLVDGDIAALNRFYSSPAGQRTMRAIANNIDTTALAARAKANPGGFQMTTDDTRGMIDPGFVTDMTAADRADVMKFMTSPPGRRFSVAQGDIQGAMLASQNAAMSKFMPVVQATISEAVVAHIKSIKPAK
jgi:hypothetical protein